MNSDGSGLAGLKGSPFGRSPVRKITGGVGLASKATDPKYLDSCGSSKNRRQPVFTNGFSNLGTSFSNYDLPELYAALKNLDLGKDNKGIISVRDSKYKVSIENQQGISIQKIKFEDWVFPVPAALADLVSQIHIKLSAIDNQYRGLKHADIYKLFIDANRWFDEQSQQIQNPSARFDIREPGYIKAMLTAFNSLLDHPFNERLTAEKINGIHHIAVDGVVDARISEELRPGFRERSGYKEQFGLVDHETSSKDGRSEFGSFWKGFNDRNRGILDQYHKMMGSPEKAVTLSEADSNFLNDHKINPKQLPSPEKIKSMMFPTAGPKFTKEQHTTSSNYRLHLYHGLNPEDHALQCQQGTPELFKDVVNRLLAEYYNRLTQCETDDQKLGNIVNLCQRLDQVHPFYDGNIRVFAILLLDYLCLQNGFKIPTLLDPNVFDMLSNEELISKIKDGFDRTDRMVSSRLSLIAYAKTSGNCKGVEPERILRSPERFEKVSVTKTPDRKKTGSLVASTYRADCTPTRLVSHNGRYLNLPPELNPVNLTAARGQSVLEDNGSEFPPNI